MGPLMGVWGIRRARVVSAWLALGASAACFVRRVCLFCGVGHFFPVSLLTRDGSAGVGCTAARSGNRRSFLPGRAFHLSRLSHARGSPS